MPASPNEITVAQAAHVLNRSRDQVDRYIRHWRVIEPAGLGGRGGAYLLNVDDLIVLEATARLDALGVTLPVLSTGMRSLRDRLRQNRQWRGWVVFRTDDVLLRDEAVELDELADGAAVQLIDAPQRREQLLTRLRSAPPSIGRGRPRLDSRWVQERLAVSADFGPQEVTPEEAASLTPPTQLPWNTSSRSRF